MGSFRFRRSVKIAPGVRMNFNKKSVGLSMGTRGARYSINSSGRRTKSVGIPGTGLSYRTQSGGARGSSEAVQRPSYLIRKLVFWLVVLIAVVGFTSGADGVAVWAIVIGFFVWGGCIVLAPVVDALVIWALTRKQPTR